MSVSAKEIYASAPLGAILAWSDGAPRPPARHVRKLRAWERRNGQGRLVRRDPSDNPGFHDMFTVHENNYRAGEIIVLCLHRVMSVESGLTFTIASVPEPGSALVLTSFQGSDELHHVARSRAEAEAWLSQHGYPGARIEVVPAPQAQAA